MDIDKVRDDIVKLVEEVLDKKAVAGLQADVEEALSEAQKAVEGMTEKVAELEAKAADSAAAIESLEASKTELETELAAKKDEAESLVAEKDVLLKRVEEAESTLETMEKDKLMDTRMTELDELKVARAGEARDKQASHVRDMSDEEFAAYKDDMVALREEIAASLQAEAKPEPEQKKEDDKPEEEVASNENEGEEEDDSASTPPVNVEGALETASATLPNVETAGGESKWRGFGPSLAKYIRDSRGEASEDNR